MTFVRPIQLGKRRHERYPCTDMHANEPLMIQSQTTQVRRACLSLLTKPAGSDLPEVIARIMHDKDITNRRASVALAEHLPHELKQQFLKRLINDRAPGLRRDALNALYLLEDGEADDANVRELALAYAVSWESRYRYTWHNTLPDAQQKKQVATAIINAENLLSGQLRETLKECLKACK